MFVLEKKIVIVLSEYLEIWATASHIYDNNK